MALTQRLEIRQSHALVMTPQLMQAIKLLELSNLELTTYVEKELERNPLLEHAGEGEQVVSEPPPDPAPARQDAQSDWPEDGGLSSNDEARTGGIADLDDVPPADANAAASRSNDEAAPRYSEWSGVGHGGRDGEDYNLEALSLIHI